MIENPLILITGANGFTGRHACKHFIEKGMDVIPVYRTEPKAKPPYPGLVCDITKQTDVTDLIQTLRPDYVLHLAGHNAVSESWEIPLKYLEVNVMGTLYLLEAIRKEVPNCRTLVVGSALQSDLLKNEGPLHPYGLSKALQVSICRAWEQLMDICVMTAKPTNLIGPGFSNGICSLLGSKIVDIENGTIPAVIQVDNFQAKRDFLDVRDAVSAYRKVLLQGNKGANYDIATGTVRSIKEVVEQYERLAMVHFWTEEIYPGLPKQPCPLDLRDIKQLNWEPGIAFSASLEDVLYFYRGDESI